jgi:tripartite-type tricarboxylate transporter receptor subunit TctC
LCQHDYSSSRKRNAYCSAAFYTAQNVTNEKLPRWVQARFKNVGFEGFSSTPEELGNFIKAQLAIWGKMIKDANVQLD